MVGGCKHTTNGAIYTIGVKKLSRAVLSLAKAAIAVVCTRIIAAAPCCICANQIQSKLLQHTLCKLKFVRNTLPVGKAKLESFQEISLLVQSHPWVV